MGTCFVVHPASKDPFDTCYRKIIEPVIVESGLTPHRVDERQSDCASAHEIQSTIHDCVCVIADVTDNCPQVWYWVGLATAHSKEIIFLCNILCDIEKSASLLRGEESEESGESNVLQYSTDSSSDHFERRLSSRLKQAVNKHNAFETLAHSFPVPHLDRARLSDSEMNVLQIVKDSMLSPQDCVMPNRLRNHMKEMGFFGHSFTLGLESLRDKGMIELGVEQGSFYRPYPVYQLTELGSKWLEDNYLPIVTQHHTVARDENSSPPV